jgi:hypothetical protein
MLGFLSEFAAFMKARRKFWLVPVLLMMVVLGALIVLAQGSVVAPMIYALF